MKEENCVSNKLIGLNFENFHNKEISTLAYRAFALDAHDSGVTVE